MNGKWLRVADAKKLYAPAAVIERFWSAPLPGIYKATLAFALFGLAFAACLIIPGGLTGPLVLLYFPLWFMWMACALAFSTRGHLRRLVALWGWIDAGLLVTCWGMAGYGRGHRSLAILISFLPAVVPTIFFLPATVTDLPIPTGMEQELGQPGADCLWSWLMMSCIALLQSVALVIILFLLRWLHGRQARASAGIYSRWSDP